MIEYEYDYFTGRSPTDKEWLNKMGKEGWQLVGWINPRSHTPEGRNIPTTYTLIMMRQKPV